MATKHTQTIVNKAMEEHKPGPEPNFGAIKSRVIGKEMPGISKIWSSLVGK